jgi:hypothetical protein
MFDIGKTAKEKAKRRKTEKCRMAKKQKADMIYILSKEEKTLNCLGRVGYP